MSWPLIEPMVKLSACSAPWAKYIVWGIMDVNDVLYWLQLILDPHRSPVQILLLLFTDSLQMPVPTRTLEESQCCIGFFACLMWVSHPNLLFDVYAEVGGRYYTIEAVSIESVWAFLWVPGAYNRGHDICLDGKHLPCPLPHLHLTYTHLEAYPICSELDLSVDHTVVCEQTDPWRHQVWQVRNIIRSQDRAPRDSRVNVYWSGLFSV